MKPFAPLTIKRQETPEEEPGTVTEMSLPLPPSLKRKASSELLENMPSEKTPKTPANSFRPISGVSPTMSQPRGKTPIRNQNIPNMNRFSISPQGNAYRSNIYVGDEIIRKVVPQKGEIGIETKREIAVYQRLQGISGTEQYIMPYIGSTNISKMNQVESLFLNMGYLGGSDIIDYLKKNPGLPLEKRKKLIIKIAEALRWYSDQGFLHGDIKFDNLFRETNGNIRLIDLGLTLSLEDPIRIPYGTSGRMVRIDSARVGNIRNEMQTFRKNIIKELMSQEEITQELLNYLETAPDKIGLDLKQTMNDFYTTIIAELEKSSSSSGGGTRRRHRHRKTHRKNRRHQ
jgi:hypothetical protein